MKIGSVALLIVSQVRVASAWMGRPLVEKDASLGTVHGEEVESGLVGNDHHMVLSPENPSSASHCESQLVSKLKLTCHDTEADRIGVSIALTLCSITSARQQPPTECDAWSAIGSFQRGAEGWKDMPGGGVTDVDKRGRCLEALHRSPQDWSSYNGFLSNAMQLCHALQGKQQQEMARSIYANISQEKMDLLRYLKRNEEIRMHEQGMVQEALQERIQALGAVHESARHQHDTLANLIARSATHEDQAHSRLLQSIQDLRNAGEGWWEEVRSRVQEQLDVDVVNARRVVNVQVTEMRGLLDNLLSAVTEKQHAEMRSMVTQHQSNQDAVWEREQARVAQFIGGLALMTTDVGERLAGIGSQVSLHQESLNTVSLLANQLPPMLEMALKQSQALHSMQQAKENTTRRNLNLVENVNDRLMKSLEIAEHSNIAFDELREVIARQSNMGFPLWRYLELAGNFLPYFSSPSFMALKSQPLMSPFALLITTLGTVCFNALAFAFYSITTVWVIFRTGIWRLARRACCLLHSEYQALRQEYLRDVERASTLTAVKDVPQLNTLPRHRIVMTKPVTPRRTAQQPVTQPTLRRISFGRRVDSLARRAQSEPPL